MLLVAWKKSTLQQELHEHTCCQHADRERERERERIRQRRNEPTRARRPAKCYMLALLCTIASSISLEIYHPAWGEGLVQQLPAAAAAAAKSRNVVETLG